MAAKRSNGASVAPRGNRVKQVTPLTKTTRAQYSRFSDSFVPGWDKKAGAEQAMDRTAERAKMGAKMTPINRPIRENQR